MPDSLKRPWVRGSVVPKVSAWISLVGEFVPDGNECFAAVVGALDLLAEPSAGLRNIKPIRINRRTFEVINLPPAEMWALDVPMFTLCVGTQDESPLPRTCQNSD